MAKHEIFEYDEAKDALLSLGHSILEIKDEEWQKKAIPAYAQLLKSFKLVDSTNIPALVDVLVLIERGKNR